MKKKLTLFLFMIILLCIPFGCRSTASTSGVGAVAGSPAGIQATPEKGPGSLGSFLYYQDQK